MMSKKVLLVCFLCTTLLIAAGFWAYLNMQASVNVTARNALLNLPEQLPVQVAVNNALASHAKGELDTVVAVDEILHTKLTGRYDAHLAYRVQTPVTVSVDYETTVRIDDVLNLEATTDLVYKGKLLPKFPLKLDVPIKMDVPFVLKRTYTVPLYIDFDGPVTYEVDEPVSVPIKDKFKNTLKVDDPMTMTRVGGFGGVMQNKARDTRADLSMGLDIPFENLKRNE